MAYFLKLMGGYISPAALETSTKWIQNGYCSFAKIPIPKSQIFAHSPLCYAVVNLKPLVPGHVLVLTKRVVERVKDVKPEELSDLWSLAQQISTPLEQHFGADSISFVIQDGPNAGQTVKHVHVHVIPRKKNDFKFNDEIYQQLRRDGEDDGRVARSEEEMAVEATLFRKLVRTDCPELVFG